MSAVSATEQEVPVPDAPPAAPREPSRFSKFLAAKSQKFGAWLTSRRFGKFTTSLALILTIVLLGLGSWQMERLHWKNELLDDAIYNFKAAPADLTHAIPTDDNAWTGLHYKSVVLKGKWLAPYHAIKMGPRTNDGEAGYQLIIPLVLKDNQVVLVNRGFIPDKMGVLPPATQDAIIHGVAYVPETKRPYFMPENIPSRGTWVWPDMTAMGHEVGRDKIVPVMVYENQVDGSKDFPIGGQLPLPSSNSHWHYAVTWYALALALIGIWLMASNPKQEVQTTLGEGKDKPLDPVAQRGMYPEATD